MALTQGAWSSVTVNGFLVATCNVAFTTAENDAYTLKTPTTLNPAKKWILLVIPAATADGSALPVDLWIGRATTFALSGDSTTVAATAGSEYKNIIDDASAATARAVLMDPDLEQAEVVAIATGGLKCKVPVAPYYAINLDGASTLNATNCDFYIIQAS